MKTVTEEKARQVINPEVFMHDEDRRTLDALKKVPFFDKICSSLIGFINEPITNVFDMSSKIRITEEQMPKIYFMVKEICEDLNIQMPNLYLELNREPNASTYGDKTATISVTSGLLECLSDDEVYAALAHECGHIACHHVLYHTMGNLLLEGGAIGIESILGKNLLTSAILMPIKYAFFRWMRASEFSADRAAAVCCRGEKAVVGTMMRLAGGTQNINEEVNEELFAAQAENYQTMLDEKTANKFIEFCLTFYASHPLNAVRAHEIKAWCEREEFEELIAKMPKREKKKEEPKSKKKWYQFWEK